MKAVLLQQPKEIDIVEVPRPDQQGKVLIQVRSMGICGSDIAAYKGVSPLVTYPRILGHEIAGDVVSVPEQSEGVAVGDRVIVEPYRYCGACYPCQIGRTNCCEHLKVIGVHEDGGMREYYAHDPHLIHRVPDALAWDRIPMIEPLSIAIHGIHRLNVQAGEHVAITGAGQIGLLAAQVARYLHAIPILIDPVRERLELARQIGIEHVIDPVTEDAAQKIQTITSGRLVEAFLEASGSAAAVRSSIDLTHYAGRVAFLGWPKDEVSLPTFLFTKKELDVRGSRNSVGEFPLAIELLASDRINVDTLISKVIAFDDIPEYVRLIAEHPADYIKVIAVFPS
ncbi:MAG: alcohol dehydrogenase catalytic domain-containing protein [Candidatus Vecturithrix sp.]|jgi:threonine dehydrogenase-like Zn-dependent dehydrogenase|nr:alcohol dehydrogenase catalytic domain-containing protein [Candidatus Vecturithrix sp.]